MPILSEEQLTDTSRDQCLVYHLGHALQSGVVPDKIDGATIGLILHARWLTLVACILRKGLSNGKPSNFHLPVWLRIKNAPQCQSGALHFYFMIELSRELGIKSEVVIHEVLQCNSYWAHTENIITACMADTDNNVKTKCVQYILDARKTRKFLPPDINLEAKSSVELIEKGQGAKDRASPHKANVQGRILSGLEESLELPSYPFYTKDVERLVSVVTESCL